MFEGKKKIQMWADCGDDFYYGREGEKVDYEMAVEFYEKAMKKKHPHATYMLGLCYELGRFVDKDLEFAEILYENATQYGDEDAKERLKTGKAFEPSLPSEEEDEDEEENDQGDDSGDDDLFGEDDDPLIVAIAYHEEKDYKHFALWLRKAAEQGNAEAMCFLGLSLLEGDGMPQDLHEGAQWIEKAAQAGDTDAMMDHADRLMDKGDNKKAEGWLRKAAESGNADAMLRLSEVLYKNAWHTKDMNASELVEESTEWLQKAAECGNKQAASKIKDAERHYGKMEKRQRQEAAHEKWAAQREQLRQERYEQYLAKRKIEKEADRKRMSQPKSASSNHWAGSAAATRQHEKAAEAQRAKNNKGPW